MEALRYSAFTVPRFVRSTGAALCLLTLCLSACSGDDPNVLGAPKLDGSLAQGGSGGTGYDPGGMSTLVSDGGLLDSGPVTGFDCQRDGCDNGGRCQDDGSCNCAAGFEGINCFVNVNECGPDSCAHGGICVDGVDGFTCSCAPGFVGVTCADATCHSGPCHNGARCTDEGGSSAFSCSCAAGFSGNTCATNIDDCAGLVCQHGGSCVDAVGSASCDCAPGYAGDRCQVETCANSPCDQGSCSDEPSGFSCECTTGYDGDRCDQNPDDCASSPCKNGASCQDGLADYSCACSQGWAGKDCDVAVASCTPNPCQNGGACNEVTGNFDSCSCPDGYSGTLCETDINECQGKDCSGHGYCVDQVNGYMCQCDSGYEGADCQTNPDDCQGHQCDHGSCVDGLGEYSCDCDTGYGGDHCDTPVDCGALTAPDDGSVATPMGTAFSSTGTYSCDSGFVLNGPAERSCQANGQWSGSAPGCDTDLCAGASIWELTYSLPLLSGDYPNTNNPAVNENTIQVLDTPFNAGDASRHIGPGTITIRLEVSGGQPTGGAYLRELDQQMNFTIDPVESQLAAFVSPDTMCGNAADGDLSGTTLSWSTIPDSTAQGGGLANVHGHGSSGNLICTGILCAFAGLSPGVNPVMNGPSQVFFQDWEFDDASLTHFFMPLSIVSTDNATTRVQFSGTLIDKTCLSVPACDPQ